MNLPDVQTFVPTLVLVYIYQPFLFPACVWSLGTSMLISIFTIRHTLCTKMATQANLKFINSLTLCIALLLMHRSVIPCIHTHSLVCSLTKLLYFACMRNVTCTHPCTLVFIYFSAWIAYGGVWPACHQIMQDCGCDMSVCVVTSLWYGITVFTWRVLNMITCIIW